MITTYISEDDRFSGAAYIAGRRITVQDIAEHYILFDWSAEQISKAFQLSLAAVHAALSYYYEHDSAMNAAIEADMVAGNSALNLQDAINRSLPLLITPQEAAEERLITYKGVLKAIDNGQIRARKFGSTWLLLRRDAEKLWGVRLKQR